MILRSRDTDTCQGFLPLLLAIYDYWYVQRRRRKSDNSSLSNGQTFRHIWPAIFLTSAYTVKPFVMSAHRSTYICPLSSSGNVGVLLMQIASTLLDCYCLVSITETADTRKADVYPKSDNRAVVVGSIFLVNSAITL